METTNRGEQPTILPIWDTYNNSSIVEFIAWQFSVAIELDVTIQQRTNHLWNWKLSKPLIDSEVIDLWGELDYNKIITNFILNIYPYKQK